MIDRLLQKTATLFRLDDTGWERHANPWSVWTRVAIWPLLLIVLWSFHWVGALAALPLGFLVLWAAVNPRAFPPPASTRSWASRGVLGERIYLDRAGVPVPRHHAVAAHVLAGAGIAGTAVMFAGLFAASPPLYLAGAVTAFLTKMWFMDRMVWLFDDMSREHARYAAWLR
jgi:hypothetical protein